MSDGSIKTNEQGGAFAALLDDPNFRGLQTLLEEPHTFNIFEAIGMAQQEIRHSTLLANLLNPRYPHGLGDGFVRGLLSAVLHENPTHPLHALHVHMTELRFDPVLVRREWQNIDILLESPNDRLVLIIENKIWTGEHDNQLARYLKIVQQHYSGWTIVPLFLTPDSLPPTDERYLLLDYNVIIRLIERLIEASGPTPDPAVQITLAHYIQMLRRHIVFDADSEAARAARRLFNTHEKLIGMLVKQREQRQQMIRTTVESLIQHEGKRLRLDQKGISRGYWWFTRFAPAAWYEAPHLHVSTWTNTKMVILFQLIHTPHHISLNLAVGPDRTKGTIRSRLYEIGQSEGPAFAPHEGLHENFFAIYSRQIFGPETPFFTDYTDAQIRQALAEAWQEFVQKDLLRIERVITDRILTAK